jgi:hypothetical protein
MLEVIVAPIGCEPRFGSSGTFGSVHQSALGSWRLVTSKKASAQSAERDRSTFWWGVVDIQSADVLNRSSGYDFKAFPSELSGKCFNEFKPAIVR